MSRNSAKLVGRLKRAQAFAGASRSPGGNPHAVRFRMDLSLRLKSVMQRGTMTLSSIQSLPDLDLEAKIARLLGWTKLQIVQGDHNGAGQLRGVPPDGYGGHLFSVPAYSRSRDAAAEIEQEIGRRGLRNEYVTTLRQTIQTSFSLWGLVTATPRQRLEAAFFTLGGQHR